MQYHVEGDEGGAFRSFDTLKDVFNVMNKTSDTILLFHLIFSSLFSMLGLISKRRKHYVHKQK